MKREKFFQEMKRGGGDNGGRMQEAKTGLAGRTTGKDAAGRFESKNWRKGGKRAAKNVWAKCRNDWRRWR